MKNFLGETVPADAVETCRECGMVANLDPWFHAQRYGHQPTVKRDGVLMIHDGAGAFVAVASR